MKKFFWGIIFVVLAYLAASPYVFIAGLQADIQAKDGEALAAKVDFPSVRESLKSQFNASVAAGADEFSDEFGLGAAGRLGTALASTLVNSLVDALITPDGLIRLFAEGKSNADSGVQASDADDNESAISEAKLAYEGLNKFSATFEGDVDEEIKVILLRDGLSWKITEIRLPL